MAQQGRTLDPAEQVGVQHEVHGDTPAQRKDAHQELGGETMPDVEAVLRHRRAEHGTRGRIESRTDCRCWSNADNEAGQNEKLGRQPHEEWRLMRCARQIFWSGTEEDVADEA